MQSVYSYITGVAAEQLIQIRLKHEAPDDVVDECGHPQHELLHLMVTPISGCAGFEPAPATPKA